MQKIEIRQLQVIFAEAHMEILTLLSTVNNKERNEASQSHYFMTNLRHDKLRT